MNNSESVWSFFYSGRTHDYDVAIIKLSEDIEFNNNVQPACLPEVDTVYEPGKKCFISGWGRTGDGKVLFLIRHPLTLPVKYS